MRRYTPAALSWVAAVSITATLSCLRVLWGSGYPPRSDWLAFGALALCAAVAHVFPIRSATNDASFRLTNAFIVAGAVILPGPLLIALVVLGITPEACLNRGRSGAFIRWSFNTAQTVLATFAASGWIGWAGRIWPTYADQPGQVWYLLVVAVGAAIFVVVQAFLVGIVISLQSRVPLHHTDTFSAPALQSDALIALPGVLVAVLWALSPSLLLLVPPVLFFVHRLTRNAHLAQVAQIDMKTGLYNSRYFEQTIEEELRHSKRIKRPLSLLFADLDHFKRVNDQHGHAAGDQVLKQVATLLTSLMRMGDVVARFGGEEFVVVLPGTDARDAATLAERIRAAVEQNAFIIDGGIPLHCTISIGIASYPDDASDLAGLLEVADAAMYRAKLTRNAVSRARALPAVPRLTIPAALAGTGADTSVGEVSSVGVARRKPVARARETGPAPARSPLGALLLWAVVALGAVSAVLALYDVHTTAQWQALLPFIALGAIAEFLRVDVYHTGRHGISLSFTIAATMAAMAVHPPMAPLVSLSAGLVHILSSRRRAPLGKTLFNLANPTLAAAIASGLYLALVSGEPRSAISASGLAAGLASVIVFYLANVGVISLVIAAHTGRSFSKVLRESAWFAPTNVVIGLTGAFLGGAHPQLGTLGVMMFVAPMLVLRFTLTLYARQSERTIETLQVAKTEVEAAHEEKEDILRRLIETVALVIDARDNSVSGHSRRVARYAVAVGRELGLDASELASLHTAGLFHDLGKVGIPEAILHKPGKLTFDEFTVVKGHTALGERILARVPQLREIARMVGEHHERYDGTGYPRGLSGKDISIGGRILVVVDSLETMLAERPYSPPRSFPEALAELDRCAGTHFDAEVVAGVHRVLLVHGEALFTDSADDLDPDSIVIGDIVDQASAWATERLLLAVAA